MKKITRHLSQYTPGFALPTILIASVVMMAVLLAAVQASVSIRSALDNQYYSKIAQEAAESGITRLVECFRNNQMPQTGVKYVPNSTSCTNPGLTVMLSPHVLGGTTTRTRYEVTVTDEGSGYHVFKAAGVTELFRSGKLTGSGSIVRTVNTSVNAKVRTQALTASTSASGAVFVCGIVNAQSYCWGKNDEGQLGNGTSDIDLPFEDEDNNGAGQHTGYPQLTKVKRATAGPLLTDGRELDIAAGEGFACAVTTTATNAPANRKVACWGSRVDGRFGDNIGIAQGSYLPYPKLTSSPWASVPQYPANIVTGPDFACLRNDRPSGDATGNVWCWGNGYRASTGQHTDAREVNTHANYNPAGDVSYQPVRVRSLGGATANGIYATKISATPNAYHVCAIANGSFGNVYCWGFNTYGQVGDGTDGEISTTNDSYRYKAVSQVIMRTTNADLVATDIAVGGIYGDGSGQSCAVGGAALTEKKIYCWGSNSHGQQGDNLALTTNQLRAGNVTCVYYVNSSGGCHSNYTAELVAVANQTVCATVNMPSVTPSKQVACWGSDERGEIGNGSETTVNISRPVTLPFFSGKTVTAINGGGFRFCAVADGKNYCWGLDHAGQVGDGRHGSGSRCPNVTGTGNPTYEPSPQLACFLEQVPYVSY